MISFPAKASNTGRSRASTLDAAGVFCWAEGVEGAGIGDDAPTLPEAAPPALPHPANGADYARYFQITGCPGNLVFARYLQIGGTPANLVSGPKKAPTGYKRKARAATIKMPAITDRHPPPLAAPGERVFAGSSFGEAIGLVGSTGGSGGG